MPGTPRTDDVIDDEMLRDIEATPDAEPSPDDDDDLDFAPRRDDGWVAVPATELNVRPANGGTSAAVSLSVRPQKERVASVFEAHEVPAVARQRRSHRWARRLSGTIASALILMGVIGVGYYALEERIKAGPLSAAQRPFVVEAVGEWVVLNPSQNARVLSPDGAFRLRVGGRVYTLDGTRKVRVPADADAAIFVISAPTKVVVSLGDE